MYDDKITNNVIDDLESKELNIINTMLSLTSQGYLVNKSKYIKLSWFNIVLHAFENIDIFNKEQQDKIERIYNKIPII